MSTLNQGLTSPRPANMSRFQVGDTVGDYRITEILGAGAAGQVFRVEHTVTRRVEAMKVLIDGRTGQRDLAQRFLREIKVQASLNHPGIASVYNAFWVKDDLVMIMELVQGHPLSRILERERLTLATALDYLSQALAALHYAHAHGVIHRDISPNNMLVTPVGSLKITDFGLAKTPNDQHLTATGAVIGTVHYMSPEQVRGRPADMRSDLYAIGCVLYELAAGRKPFEGGNSFAVMQAHVEDDAQAPSRANPTVPRSLDTVILRALAKRPEDRFQTAEEFRIALDLVRSEIGGRRREDRASAPVSQPAPTPAQPARISRTGVIAIAAGTCLFSFGGYVAIMHFHGSSGQAVETKQPSAIVQAKPTAVDTPAPPDTPKPAVDTPPVVPEVSPAPQRRIAKSSATKPAAAVRSEPGASLVDTAAAKTISEPPPALSSAPAVHVQPPSAASVHTPDITASHAPPKAVADADDEPTKKKPGRVKRIFGRILGRNRNNDVDQ